MFINNFLSNSDLVWNKTANEYFVAFLCVRSRNIFGAIFFVTETEKKKKKFQPEIIRDGVQKPRQNL